VSGTLQGRLVGSETKGRVYAKTGTLSGQINLAGYYHRADKEWVPFSIFGASKISDSTVRSLTDRAVVAWIKEESEKN
jgi:D-alanyl-D-alanine carboxypeptidase